MIKSLSPYYINIPFVNPLTEVTCTSYVLEVYVWDGDKDAIPSEANYIITKTNPTASTGNDKINIAELVNDFVDFTPNKSSTTELNDGNNQVWVLTQVFYNDQPTVSQIYTVQLCLKGYGYGLSGENPQPPTNKILIPIIEYKVNRNGVFNVPILIDEPTPPTAVFSLESVVLDTGTIYEITFTQNFVSPTVRVLYKLIADTDYIYLDGEPNATSPMLIDFGSLPSGTYDVILRAYNVLDGVTYETNSVEITI